MRMNPIYMIGFWFFCGLMLLEFQLLLVDPTKEGEVSETVILDSSIGVSRNEKLSAQHAESPWFNPLTSPGRTEKDLYVFGTAGPVSEDNQCSDDLP